MFIRYLGHACFLISGDKSVVIDPHAEIGYDMDRVECDYCLSSHAHFDHSAVFNTQYKILIQNLEEISRGKEISLEAFEAFHDDDLGSKRGKTLIFSMIIDGVRFTHLGDLGENFSQKIVEKIGKTDVLFIPVGGTYTIDAIEAQKYAKAVNAKITVPMHFKTPRSSVEVDAVNKFLALADNVVSFKGDFTLTKETLPNADITLCFDGERF